MTLFGEIYNSPARLMTAKWQFIACKTFEAVGPAHFYKFVNRYNLLEYGPYDDRCSENHSCLHCPSSNGKTKVEYRVCPSHFSGTARRSLWDVFSRRYIDRQINRHGLYYDKTFFCPHPHKGPGDRAEGKTGA